MLSLKQARTFLKITLVTKVVSQWVITQASANCKYRSPNRLLQFEKFLTVRRTDVLTLEFRYSGKNLAKKIPYRSLKSF